MKYQRIIEKVLAKYIEHSLAVNLAKSIFYKREVNFLSYIINGSEIQIEADKVETIKNWPIPNCNKQEQFLLGFANYYCNFIARYSQKARLLTKLNGNISFI